MRAHTSEVGEEKRGTLEEHSVRGREKTGKHIGK